MYQYLLSTPRRFMFAAALSWALVGCGSMPWDKKDDAAVEDELEADFETDPSSPDNTYYSGNLINLEEIKTAFGLHEFYDQANYGSGVTVAIFDNGYGGLQESLGETLPPDLLVEPAAKDEMKQTNHGTKLAELVHAVATGSPYYVPSRARPKILLYNTNGLKNLQHAATDVLNRNVDYVLYAQIWEYGGNLDGKGFINKVFKPLTDAGITVINAAGNFGKSAYQAPIKIDEQTDKIVLPHQGKYLQLVINLPQTPVKISLGWNDFTDDINYRTSQDLNIRLLSAKGELVSASELIQDGTMHSENTAAYSAHAREVMNTVLEPGTYWLEIDAKSKNFRDDSFLWVAVNGPETELLERNNANSVFIPADSPETIATGASDVDYSSSAAISMGAAANKPDVMSWSKVMFGSGEQYDGTSAASALVAGYLALVSSGPYGKLDRREILQLANSFHIARERKASGPAPKPMVPVLGN